MQLKKYNKKKKLKKCKPLQLKRELLARKKKRGYILRKSLNTYRNDFMLISIEIKKKSFTKFEIEFHVI